METETTTWSGFLNEMRENHCRTNISTRGKKNPQNRESQFEIQVGRLTV